MFVFSLNQQNETFILCECFMAKCIENNTIEIVPYECPPLVNITCANGKKPVLVYDEHHCCQHYACDCKPYCCLQDIFHIFIHLHYLPFKIKILTFPCPFQVHVKDGVILIISHLMDSTTVIKETVHMS